MSFENASSFKSFLSSPPPPPNFFFFFFLNNNKKNKKIGVCAWTLSKFSGSTLRPHWPYGLLGTGSPGRPPSTQLLSSELWATQIKSGALVCVCQCGRSSPTTVRVWPVHREISIGLFIALTVSVHSKHVRRGKTLGRRNWRAERPASSSQKPVETGTQRGTMCRAQSMESRW